MSNVKCQMFYPFFLWNFLSLLGYQIDLYNCANCHNKLYPNNLYFSPEQGGIICSNCVSVNKSPESISSEAVKIIRIFIKKDWNTLSKLKIPELYNKELESVSDKYIFYLKENINMV